MPQAMLTEADDGRGFALQVGQEVTVMLEEIAGAGYQWAEDAGDPARVVVRRAQADRSGAAASGALGSAGRVAWTLEARAPGRARVALKLWRPWEGEASVVRRFSIELDILP